MPVFFLRPLPEFDVFQIDRGNRKLALELTVSRRHLDALDRRLYFAKTFSIETDLMVLEDCVSEGQCFFSGIL